MSLRSVLGMVCCCTLVATESASCQTVVDCPIELVGGPLAVRAVPPSDDTLFQSMFANEAECALHLGQATDIDLFCCEVGNPRVVDAFAVGNLVSAADAELLLLPTLLSAEADQAAPATPDGNLLLASLDASDWRAWESSAWCHSIAASNSAYRTLRGGKPTTVDRGTMPEPFSWLWGAVVGATAAVWIAWGR